MLANGEPWEVFGVGLARRVFAHWPYGARTHMTNAGIAVNRVGDAVRRFRRIVDLHAEGKRNWEHAETVRLEVERLYETYTDILMKMSDDEFAKHLNSRRRPL